MEHASDDERRSTDPPAAAVNLETGTIAIPSNNKNISQHQQQEQEQHHLDSLIAESLSNGVSVSNGTIVPPPPTPPPTTTTNATITTTTPTSTLEQPHAKQERPISGVVPPYWKHQRNFSRASLASADTARSSKPAITLEDHTEDPDSETTRGLWAKSVAIDDHVVVSGKTGVGAYVVWMCSVQTLDGGPMTIRMRYSQFDELRDLLVKAFPHAKHALPPLPPKSALFKFRPKFLEARRVGLQYFLNCVLLNPEFSGSPVLKDFLFSHVI